MDLPTFAPASLFTLCLQLIVWLACLNAAAWALVGIDRDRWAFGGRRMSGTALFWLAVLGGWPGLVHALRKSRRVRYDYAIRGRIRAVAVAQAVCVALALTPQGAISKATATLASLILPETVAVERVEQPRRSGSDQATS